MNDSSKSDPLRRWSAYFAMPLGSLMIIAGLAFLFVSSPSSDNKLKIGPVELTTTVAVMVMVIGALLVALPWLPLLIQRPKPLAQPTSMGLIEAKPHAKAGPTTEAVILNDASTLFVPPHDKTRWEVIGPDDMRSMDDISFWDVPMIKASNQIASLPDGQAPRPLSQYYLRYKHAVAVGLNIDSTVDGLSYSGKLPKDPALYDRILRSGSKVILLALRHNLTQLEEMWKLLEIGSELPTLKDGSPDVDAALRAMEAPFLQSIQGESGDQGNAQIESMLASQKNEVPVQKRLFHSLSYRIYRASDILASDPMIRLIFGDKMSTWNFVNCLPQIDRSVYLGAMKNMQWTDNGDSLAFTLASRLENVEINGKLGILDIRRLFFIVRDEGQFHLLRADFLDGPGVDAASAYEDMKQVLGSWRVGTVEKPRRLVS